MFRFLFLMAILGGATATLAQPAPQPLELLRSGQYDAARIALQPIVQGRPTAKADTEVFEAMILAHKGQASAAVSLLRKVLINSPNHEAARRELVFLLAARKDHKAAVFHAERLIGQTADKRLAQDLSQYIALNTSGKPRGLAFRFSILPSSNFNQGTQNTELAVGDLTFAIDEASKARSGVGVSAGFTAWNRWQIKPKWDATLQGSLDVKTYPREAVPTELTFDSKLLFRRAYADGSVSFGPAFNLSRSSGKTQRKRLGSVLIWHHNLDRRQQLNFKLAAFKQTYPGRAYKDGTLLQGRINYRHILSPSTVFSVSIPVEKERTNRAHLDHTEVGLSVGLAHDWRNGLSTSLSLGVSHDRYDGLFPGFTVARFDQRKTIGIRLKNRKLKVGRFVPEISYDFTHASSNVGFFEYSSHDVGLSFSSNF